MRSRILLAHFVNLTKLSCVIAFVYLLYHLIYLHYILASVPCGIVTPSGMDRKKHALKEEVDRKKQSVLHAVKDGIPTTQIPRVAIVVPIRDEPLIKKSLSQSAGRWENAKKFVEYMCVFLPKAQAPVFDIVFIEQSKDGRPFNKGSLFNAAYFLTVNRRGYTHMVLHDVDQLPENVQNSYGVPTGGVSHLLTAASQWGYIPMNTDTVGGALSVTYKTYEELGGYSNKFWGWGGEDNNMYQRILARPNTKVNRPPLDVGRYTSLDHPRVRGLDETSQFRANRNLIRDTDALDGLKTVKYNPLGSYFENACNTTNEQHSNLVIVHTIDILNTENLVSTLPETEFTKFKQLQLVVTTSVNMHVPCNVKILTHEINVANGGEEIDSVYMRPEDEEYPVYSRKSFQSECKPIMSRASAKLTQVYNSFEIILQQPLCDGGNMAKAIMMQRYEYANVYHTINDWLMLYDFMQMKDLRHGDFDLVWLDGHAKGSLDPGWRIIFTPRVVYVKGAASCYKTVDFVADGSNSALMTGCINRPSKISHFTKFVLERFKLYDHFRQMDVSTFHRKVLVIDRQPYMAHPRIKLPLPKYASRGIANIQTLKVALQHKYVNHSVEVISLASLSLENQIKAFATAHVVVAMHGAALTYMIFMPSGSTVLELSVESPTMYTQVSQCAPWITYKRHYLTVDNKGHNTPSNYHVDVESVISAL